MAISDLTVTISVTPIPWWQWLWMVPRNLYNRREWPRKLPMRWHVITMLFLATRRMTVERTSI